MRRNKLLSPEGDSFTRNFVKIFACGIMNAMAGSLKFGTANILKSSPNRVLKNKLKGAFFQAGQPSAGCNILKRRIIILASKCSIPRNAKMASFSTAC